MSGTVKGFLSILKTRMQDPVADLAIRTILAQATKKDARTQAAESMRTDPRGGQALSTLSPLPSTQTLLALLETFKRPH